MSFDTSCLYSTVKNTSGKRMPFGFLPPHGRTLEVDEEFTVFGDIRQAVFKDIERTTGRRSAAAFEAALQRGDMQILSTPAPILRDTADDSVHMLQVTGDALVVVDPCFYNSTS